MKKQQKTAIKTVPQKRVEIIFDQFSQRHQHPSNQLIHWVCVPLILFSVLGLVWSIPFPHLAFLGKYNGFVNWASFLIAFSGYYYYRLSPVLSYMMILLVFVMSLLITQLEKWELAGGPAVWLVCAVILIFAEIGHLIGHRMEGKRPSIAEDVRFLFIGPIWLLQILCIKAGLKWN